MKSKFGKGGPYAMIQIRDGAGKRFYTTSSSKPVLDALEQVEGTLPVRCKIGRRRSERTGKWYWMLESSKS